MGGLAMADHCLPRTAFFHSSLGALSLLVIALGLTLFSCEKAENTKLSTAPDSPREDMIPPAAPRLTVDAFTDSSVTFIWTAPGDDGSAGTASQYDMRRSNVAITDQAWDSAARVSPMPAPKAAGAAETLTVSGLSSVTTYYFAMKAADEARNWSPLSNVISETLPERGLVRLTQGKEFNTTPDWSPDGHSIAFVENHLGDTADNLVVIPAGGGPADLIASLPGLMTPDWSPDGLRIAFAAANPGPGLVWNLWSVIPGGDPMKLTDDLAADSYPDWSPDGSRIVFCSDRGGHMDIWVLVLATHTYTQITDDSIYDFAPAWSPDGSRIAYCSWKSGNSDIWVVPAGGGSAVQLTDTSEFEGDPCWSPDGSRIAYHKHTRDDLGAVIAGDIWIVPSAGGAATRATIRPGLDFSPSWSPDGARIVFASDRMGSTDIWIVEVGP